MLADTWGAGAPSSPAAPFILLGPRRVAQTGMSSQCMAVARGITSFRTMWERRWLRCELVCRIGRRTPCWSCSHLEGSRAILGLLASRSSCSAPPLPFQEMAVRQTLTRGLTSDRGGYVGSLPTVRATYRRALCSPAGPCGSGPSRARVS